MKINILSIGKFKEKHYEELYNEYKKRIPYNIFLRELEVKKDLSGEKLKEEEGKLLLQNCNKGKIISLDERGKIITTNEFCNLITDDVNFVIGGSDGLSQDVRDKSSYVMSFGKMVFPHLMVRVMLVEQIYRTYTLKIGHPYHK
ncbi:MAG: 23S rRNA (pseudouridine(1915)-N(3))-methyltransferase RlmH [Rickettsiales bacterium]|jgi:23S rRNA (pseudouridine1915-N3)-methyltransferase|nr:23S rRNA (pseudouridine(1915)-N(3))-methyltransferase RlmH [Rickettsiales bacterium]